MPAPSPRNRSLIRMLIVVGGLLVAVNVIIIAGVNQRTNSQPTLPTEITELIPKPGDLVSPNAMIGVNLRDDLTGILELDGVEIPEDQLQVQLGGIVTFTPGAAKEYTQLPRGAHTITVIYWPTSSTREKGTSAYTWNFSVGA